MCRDGLVRAGDFRFAPLAQPVVANTPPIASPVPAEPLTALEQAIESALGSRRADLFHSIEALLVRCAFARCRDNQVQTARLLGITRNTLRTLLKRHGLLSGALADTEAEAALEG